MKLEGIRLFANTLSAGLILAFYTTCSSEHWHSFFLPSEAPLEPGTFVTHLHAGWSSNASQMMYTAVAYLAR